MQWLLWRQVATSFQVKRRRTAVAIAVGMGAAAVAGVLAATVVDVLDDWL
jgi:hypothetical protein